MREEDSLAKFPLQNRDLRRFDIHTVLEKYLLQP